MTNDQQPMTKQIQNPKSKIQNCWLWMLGAVVLAGSSPSALAQPQPKAGTTAAGGALEVVMAGKPTRKTLTLTTTQPARIEALEQTPIYSKLSAYVGEVLV